jgi:hypothetical protein
MDSRIMSFAGVNRVVFARALCQHTVPEKQRMVPSPGLTRLRGRSPFVEAKARPSIFLRKTLAKMDGYAGQARV